MSSLFDRMMGRSGKSSSAQAKDRLQFVLVHDRINLPPEKLNEMKEEILAVISRYVSVERESVEIALEQRSRTENKIVAQIPFVGKNPLDGDGDGDEFDDAAAKPAAAEAAAKPSADETAAKPAADETAAAEPAEAEAKQES